MKMVSTILAYAASFNPIWQFHKKTGKKLQNSLFYLVTNLY